MSGNFQKKSRENVNVHLNTLPAFLTKHWATNDDKDNSNYDLKNGFGSDSDQNNVTGKEIKLNGKHL